MYGLVQIGLRDFITERYGASVWLEAAASCGIDEHAISALEPESDHVTFGVVTHVVKSQGVPLESFLDAFGEFWVLRTAPSWGEAFMGRLGTTLPAALEALGELHDGMHIHFKGFSPPHFETRCEAPGSYLVKYWSTRSGLDAFVVGLLRGLGRRFGVEVQVTIVRPKGSANDSSEFRVAFGAA